MGAIAAPVVAFATLAATSLARGGRVIGAAIATTPSPLAAPRAIVGSAGGRWEGSEGRWEDDTVPARRAVEEAVARFDKVISSKVRSSHTSRKEGNGRLRRRWRLMEVNFLLRPRRTLRTSVQSEMTSPRSARSSAMHLNRLQ